MDTIIRNLYAGNIFPEEDYLPLSKEYEQLLKKCCKDQQAFIENLKKCSDQSLMSNFQELSKEFREMTSEEITEMFIDGFRLGARFMLEMLEDKYHYNRKE